MRKVSIVILATIVILSFSKHVRAEKSQWSLDIFGVSWHEEGKMRAHANQINPGIGLRYDLNDNWYLEGAYILKNSVRGKTAALGVGWHTEVAKINTDHSLKLGIQMMAMDYTTPHKKTKDGFVPALTAEYGFNKNITGVVYFFLDPGKCVVFGGVNYHFKGI